MKTDWIAGFLGTWSTELTLGAILLRLALSMALAAIIGCERSSKRHSAGLRTFILVSLAGTSTMLIDQYLMDVLPITIPVLSAAAVIGITTISGNSILFSSKNQIKGLTTSVGLWCCGIVGLALGAGLYAALRPLRRAGRGRGAEHDLGDCRSAQRPNGSAEPHLALSALRRGRKAHAGIFRSETEGIDLAHLFQAEG